MVKLRSQSATNEHYITGRKQHRLCREWDKFESAYDYLSIQCCKRTGVKGHARWLPAASCLGSCHWKISDTISVADYDELRRKVKSDPEGWIEPSSTLC
jgi:hypothetical protein